MIDLEVGPFDADELVRWAESYGHPELWAKKAQAAHMRAERAVIERDRYRKALVRIADAESGYWGRIAREALRGEK